MNPVRGRRRRVGGVNMGKDGGGGRQTEGPTLLCLPIPYRNKTTLNMSSPAKDTVIFTGNQEQIFIFAFACNSA